MSLGNESGAAEEKNSDCDKAGVNLHLGAETFAKTTGIVDIKTYSREKPRHAGVSMSAAWHENCQNFLWFISRINKYFHGQSRC